jgi:endoplasmic reticulum-Golgi intermediate compartment protein 2
MGTPVMNTQITVVCTSKSHYCLASNDSFSAVMNMSHVISEFSFGPYFPDITQPLDYSFEVTEERTCLWF